jgi:hypothetical protein
MGVQAGERTDRAVFCQSSRIITGVSSFLIGGDLMMGVSFATIAKQ